MSLITEKDLNEAIAECQGQKNPTTNTCIKLAAFLTIKSILFPAEKEPMPMYSFAPDTDRITYTSKTEFADAINGKKPNDIWSVMDELMTAVRVLQPKLYDSVMSKLM